jgi:hypothetical protein
MKMEAQTGYETWYIYISVNKIRHRVSSFEFHWCFTHCTARRLPVRAPLLDVAAILEVVNSLFTSHPTM